MIEWISSTKYRDLRFAIVTEEIDDVIFDQMCENYITVSYILTNCGVDTLSNLQKFKIIYVTRQRRLD